MAASAQRIATLYAELGVDSVKLEQGLKNAKLQLQDVGDKGKSSLGALNDAFQQLTGVSLTAAGAIGVGIAAFKTMIGEAMGAEDQMARTEAVLKSTGNVVGYTSDELMAMSEHWQTLTGIEHEQVGAAEAILLRFTEIGHDVFPQVLEAVINMGAATGDLSGAAMTLGKAMEDPVGMMTQLRRQGFILSEQQQQQVKDFMAVNDVASAQAVILGVATEKFGGLAEAMGNTTSGMLKKVKNDFSEIAEAIGKEFLPVLKEAVGALDLSLTGYDKIQNALVLHEKDMRSYYYGIQGYTKEMQRAAQVAGYEISATGDLVQKVDNGMGASFYKVIIPGFAATTQAEMDADKALKTYAGDFKIELLRAGQSLGEFSYDVKGELDAVNNIVMGIGMTKSMSDFTKTKDQLISEIADANNTMAGIWKTQTKKLTDAETIQINDWWKTAQQIKSGQGKYADWSNEKRAAESNKLLTKIWNVANGSYLTDEQKKQLEDAGTLIDNDAQKLQELNKQQDEAAKKLIFGTLQAQAEALLKSGTLTGPQATAVKNNLSDVAFALGLIDQKGLDMAKSLNGIDLSNPAFQLQTVLDLIKELNGQPDHTYTITTIHKDKIITDESGGFVKIVTPTKQNAGGGSFIIGPGYGYEGFRLPNGNTASPGEKVTVTPAGNVRAQKGGGDTWNVTINTPVDYRKFIRDVKRRQ